MVLNPDSAALDTSQTTGIQRALERILTEVLPPHVTTLPNDSLFSRCLWKISLNLYPVENQYSILNQKDKVCMSVAYSKLVVHHHYMYTVQQTFAGSRRRSRPSRLEVSLTIVAQIPISATALISSYVLRVVV